MKPPGVKDDRKIPEVQFRQPESEGGGSMNRKNFIQSQGATCRNWTWSWSFINEPERTIIFGAWDAHSDGESALILSETWQRTDKGKKSSGYAQSREHLRLVEEEGFRLLVFPMKHSKLRTGDGEPGPSKIAGFDPVLTEKWLYRRGENWYAEDPGEAAIIPEELRPKLRYAEGAVRPIRVNAYERSSDARRACIRHYGSSCSVCEFDFAAQYGPIGEGYIHVHHLVSLSEIGQEYEVDPIRDLIPVCPNCHAMLHHKRDIPLSINQLKQHLRPNRKAA